MKKAVIKFLATGTYTGYSPVMPGTVGTLWGVVISWLISTSPAYEQVLAIMAVSAASVYLASGQARNTGEKDPGSIVCDEVAGFMVAVFLIPFTLFNVILVFILFRFFDILKPYPVGAIDKKASGGLGIVLDDIMAGIDANIVAHIVLWAIG